LTSGHLEDILSRERHGIIKFIVIFNINIFLLFITCILFNILLLLFHHRHLLISFLHQSLYPSSQTMIHYHLFQKQNLNHLFYFFLLVSSLFFLCYLYPLICFWVQQRSHPLDPHLGSSFFYHAFLSRNYNFEHFQRTSFFAVSFLELDFETI